MHCTFHYFVLTFTIVINMTININSTEFQVCVILFITFFGYLFFYKKQKVICNYKNYRKCRKMTKYKFCDEHYEIQKQFIDKYHFYGNDYDISTSDVCIVELEMRLKFVQLFNIKKSDKKYRTHRHFYGRLFKQINQTCDLFEKTTYIKKHLTELNETVKEIIKKVERQRKKKLYQLKEFFIKCTVRFLNTIKTMLNYILDIVKNQYNKIIDNREAWLLKKMLYWIIKFILKIAIKFAKLKRHRGRLWTSVT